MKFVKFTEINDWEGETWYFWLQLDNNESELKELESWLGTFDDNGQEYELDMTPVDEKEVDALVKHGGQGYMDYHNKVTGIFICPQPSEEVQKNDEGGNWLSDNFYKGDIERHFNA